VDDLKESVQGASFEQKDPLVIYKMEAYNLFEGLVGHINSSVTAFLLKGTLVLPDEDSTHRAQQAENARRAQEAAMRNRIRANNQSSMTETQEAAQRAAQSAGREGAAQRVQPIVKEKITGRNDLCPCGSGKKFKHCHGK
jgi:preprotein translocase subunit SecA